MKRKTLLDTSLMTAGLIGIVILINILGVSAFERVDLTRSGEYTLSKASRDAVGNLKDRLTIKAYFSKGLPAPYSSNARYVRDLLEEYYAASNGNLSYEFLDPLAEETEKDKEKRKDVRQDIFGRTMRQETDVERQLEGLGIRPVEVRVNSGDNLEVKRVYMGISLRYGDQQEAIPVVTDTSKLEYDLTVLIRKMTRSKVPTLGILTGRDGLDPREDLSKFTGLLGQQYNVKMLEVGKDPLIPADVDALIVTGPEKPFTAAEAKAIGDFVRSGHAAAFLLDAIRVDLRTTDYQPAEHGLDRMLASFGVHLSDGLVLDAQCAQINVTEQRGFMRIAHAVQYPYLPMVPKLDQDHPLTRGLSDVAFPFTSAVTVDPPDGVDSSVLVSSSDQSWIASPPYDLNPVQQWPATISFDGPHPLVVALSGPVQQAAASADAKADAAAPAKWRILVAGGSSFIQNQFMSSSGQALALNLVDWLMLDQDLLNIRTRGLAEAPLDEISDTTRNVLKYGNILGVPFLFVLFGIVRWRLRERRRALITALGGSNS